MWALRWWPYAIAHGTNPFYTHLTWSPTGVNVAGSALIPLPSVLAWPLTSAVGPIASYNVIALLSPAFAALAAYLLCLELCRRRLPALASGWLFGCSSYELSQLIGHANLMLTALLPLIMLVVVLRLRRRLGRAAFVIAVAVLLAAQLLTSTELLATGCGFGLLTLLAAWLVMPSRRRELQSTAVEVVAGGVIAAVVTSPYLYYALVKQHPVSPPGTESAVSDLANLVIPTAVTWIRYAQAVSNRFPGNPAEQGAYFGVPLLAAFATAVWQLRRSAAVRLAVAVWVLALILSLGPKLYIGGHASIPLPWRLVAHRPLTRAIVPDRMIVYAWLALAVVIALWLARPGRWQIARWAIVVLGVIAIAGDGSSGFFGGRPDQPSLFTTTAYKHVLPRSGQVLVLPYGAGGYSMLWQAQSDFWFRMPEGYLSGVPPQAFLSSPLAQAFLTNRVTSATIAAFVRRYRVTTIVVDPQLAGPWPQLLAALHVTGRSIDGVLIYNARPLL